MRVAAAAEIARQDAEPARAAARRRRAALEHEVREPYGRDRGMRHFRRTKDQATGRRGRVAFLQRHERQVTKPPSLDALLKDYRRMLADLRGALDADVARARQILEADGQLLR
jgi:hypothetical protein